MLSLHAFTLLLHIFQKLVCRLAFYGLSTNMGLYLKKVLGYPADHASQLLQVWKATVRGHSSSLRN